MKDLPSIKVFGGLSSSERAALLLHCDLHDVNIIVFAFDICAERILNDYA